MTNIENGVHPLRETIDGKIILDGTKAEIYSVDPMVIMNPKGYVHYHTYGALAPFFKGLVKNKVLGTSKPKLKDGKKNNWLPPRSYCPDTLDKMEWIEVEPIATLYTHTTVLYPGAPFKGTVPCHLISVEIPNVCTKMMSYMSEGKPEIGMKLRAVFNTSNPTNTILDLSWEPV